MAQGDTPITVVGNVVADPDLRFTPNGAAVANFRVASTPRRYNSQTNQWEDGEAMFLTCNVWRKAAENVSETLQKGMRVVVTGKLKSRSYQTKEGENRTVFEVDVDEVGPSLKYATAQVVRNPRDGQSAPQSGAWGNTPQQPQGGFSQQGGWGGTSQQPQQPQQQPAQGGWGAPAPIGQDNPPNMQQAQQNVQQAMDEQPPF